MKVFKLYLIIAFLLGMVAMDFAHALKVPDIILPANLPADLKEQIDNIIDILNNGKYVMEVSASAVLSSDELDEGEFLLDDAGVNKYLVISNGTTNYRVEVTAVP